MKICYLADINNYHTQKWCNYFLSKGYDVFVISLTQGNIKGCRSYCFDFDNVKQLSTFKKLRYLNFISKIKKILNKEKPDILHSHYASSYGLMGLLTGYKPHIVSLWGTDILKFPKKSLLHRFLMKKVLNGENYIFSTSEYMINEAKQYLKKEKNIYLTPFGVDVNLYKPKLNQKASNGKFIIGVNKSLEKVSGLHILIKAFHKIVSEYKQVDFELRIAGEGSQYENLLNLAREFNVEKQIKFYGFLPQKELISFLQDLDIAVYPSISESFGVAAVEAQACGIPVIASNVDGFLESTIPGETSLLFESGNVHDLKSKIEILYKNNVKRDAMKLKGIEFVKRYLNLDNNFSDVTHLYDKITHDFSNNIV